MGQIGKGAVDDPLRAGAFVPLLARVQHEKDRRPGMGPHLRGRTRSVGTGVVCRTVAATVAAFDYHDGDDGDDDAVIWSLLVLAGGVRVFVFCLNDTEDRSPVSQVRL